MALDTVVNGQLPSGFTDKSRLSIPEFKETYRRVKKGSIKSVQTHKYLVDADEFTFTVDQTINYNECNAKPLDSLAPQLLTATRTYLSYGEKDQIIRHASLNRISTADEEDPCTEGASQCDQNAACIPEGTASRCVCKDGFEGDGHECNDIDECSLNLHDCHPNANCFNAEGSFECQCAHGYTGNGKTCTPESSGGRGDADHEDCSILNNCSPDADCVFDDATGFHQCRCHEGFDGDGFECTEQGGTDEGTGDGDDAICRRCDANAKCVYDNSRLTMVCKCNRDYSGSGFQCSRDVVPCNRLNNCHANADCLEDPSTGSYQCQCRAGYRGDGYTCNPVTDCRRQRSICDRNANCEQHGNDFVCVCKPGFRGDGSTCTAIGPADSFLLYSHGKVIYELPFKPTEDNPGRRLISVPDQVVIGLDVDCNLRQIYWTDIGLKKVAKANLDGSDQQTLVENLISPEDVAVDWLSQNVYWTDSGSDLIEVSRLDGTSRKTLIKSDLENPRAVQVDPIRGYLFWTDWNRKSPKIERSFLDGTQRQVLVSENLGLPNGLVVDSVGQRLCWGDAGTKSIECVGYDGKNRRMVFAKATYPFDVTYAQNVFYWTDWETKSLSNINDFADTANDPLMLPPGGSNGKLYGLTAVPNQCPRGTNACKVNNGGCRFLCLPTPNGGRTCACPDDIDEDECNRISLL